MSTDGPVWQDDEEVTKCFLCDSNYNLFNRRHHCRKCGRVVCAGCSSQSIRYFPNTIIVDSGGTTMSKPYTNYRTCDGCVEEIRMVRRALFAGSRTGSTISSGSSRSAHSRSSNGNSHNGHSHGHHGHHGHHGNLCGIHENDSVTKLVANTRTIPISTSSSMSDGRVRVRDTDSDANLCPVCATNLLTAYISTHKRHIQDISSESFEQFKEQHIDKCLIDFDFNESHQRLSNNQSQPANKMLVYNIPPIPSPIYESIPDEPRGSSSGDFVGSITSVSTIQQEEKYVDQYDNECLICLEDLNPGDKVGRLECLCVFHYKCIKDWFNKKGYGECPVHFLHK